jgi:hypothetical protein
MPPDLDLTGLFRLSDDLDESGIARPGADHKFPHAGPPGVANDFLGNRKRIHSRDLHAIAESGKEHDESIECAHGAK